jgi:hypothetical protein
MQVKIFSYKVEGILLEPVNALLKTSKDFDRKAVTEELKNIFTIENYKIDERSLDFKIIDGQLYIEGLAVENQEPKSIGFMNHG